jgi:hypothetical protein
VPCSSDLRMRSRSMFRESFSRAFVKKTFSSWTCRGRGEGYGQVNERATWRKRSA